MTAEWRNLTGRFEAFIANLQPSPLEKRRVAAATDEVAICLRRRFHPLGEPTLGDHLLVGGHAKGTAIRPARIADMLYVLPSEHRPSVESTGDTTRLLSEMTAALSQEFATTEAHEGGWLWVRSFDDIAIRLVPCFRTAGENLLVSLPGDSRGWLATNPMAELTRLHEADIASGGKATHLLMMLKSWRRHHRAPISSFALELLICEFVLAWTYPRRSLLFYDWMVRDFFFWIGHQAERELLTPGALESLCLGKTWARTTEKAFAAAQTACALERENKDEAATAEWWSIFGPEFTKSDPKFTAPKAIRLGSGSATQPGVAAPDY